MIYIYITLGIYLSYLLDIDRRYSIVDYPTLHEP